MKWIGGLVTFLLLAINVNAEVYQCVDANNKTVYQDSECDSSYAKVKKLNLPELTSIPAPNTRMHVNNIVVNPGFEDKLNEWIVPEYAWWDEKMGKSSSGAAVIQAEKKPNDKYGQLTSIEQCIPISNLSEYGFAVDLKFNKLPERRSASEAHLIWYKTEDCSTHGSFSTYLRPKLTTQWQHLSEEKIKPALGVKAAKIRLFQKAKFANGGEVSWDNIQLYPMKVSSYAAKPHQGIKDLPKLSRDENIVINGGFDRNVNAWRSSKLKWSNDAGNGAALAVLNSEGAGYGTSVGSQCVKLGQQRHYTLGARFLKDVSSNQTGGGRFRIHWNEKEDCTGRSGAVWKHADLEDQRGWQELIIENVEAPVEARAANIELIQSVQGPGFFAGFWDDIYMVVSQ